MGCKPLAHRALPRRGVVTADERVLPRARCHADLWPAQWGRPWPRARRRSGCQAQEQDSSARRLQQAAKLYRRELEAGEDEDEAVARGLGAGSASGMTDVQRKYADRVKAKLAEQAAAAAAAEAARQRLFTAGKRAYEFGQYPTSVELLTRALDAEGPFSALGGEIQLWLALGLQACGQEQECIDLYKALENTHPSVQVRKQAAQLRFILEAPRLKLRPDERVSVPVLETGGRFAPERGSYARAPAPVRPVQRTRPKTLEERFVEEWRPPRIFPNRYVAVATALLALGLAWYSTRL